MSRRLKPHRLKGQRFELYSGQSGCGVRVVQMGFTEARSSLADDHHYAPGRNEQAPKNNPGGERFPQDEEGKQDGEDYA